MLTIVYLVQRSLVRFVSILSDQLAGTILWYYCISAKISGYGGEAASLKTSGIYVYIQV